MSTSNQNDILIPTLKSDFENGFKLLFITYYAPLKRIAQNMVGEDYSDDVVQDLFTVMWKSRLTFENLLSLKSYLYTSIQNKCYNFIRNNKKFEAYIDVADKTHFEDAIIQEELVIQLYEAIEMLPEHYKIAMQRSLRGETIASIALAMNTTEDSVKAYKRRARELLRKKMCHQAYDFFFFI